MSEAQKPSTVYDELPYPSYTFPQTSPDRLATLAALHGLSPADPASCRYLELGCGDGTNIAYSAGLFPSSEFVGIDLSEVHVRGASETAKSLELSNARFIAADLLDIDFDELGTFDFIVAHGLFSWVPDIVRDRVLEIMGRCLTPHGIGYISYNTFPGCYSRKTGWDLMRLGTRTIEDDLQKIQAAKDGLSFVRSEAPAGTIQSFLYGQIENEITSKRPENVLYDDLAEFNQPYYFLDFAELIDKYDLQYMCEAEPTSLGDGSISRKGQETLDSLAADRLLREQYLDFIEFAKFRMSLVCRKSPYTVDGMNAGAVSAMYARTSLGLVSENDGSAKFSTPNGRTINLNHPATISMLDSIGSVDSAAFKISDLPIPEPEDRDRTFAFLLQLFQAGLLQLFTSSSRASIAPAERPKAHAFARWQAENGCDNMTTLFCENIAFDSDLVRAMISLLDGTRDKDSLAADLIGKLGIDEESRAEALQKLPPIIDANLKSFADLGLLTAE